MNVIIVRVSGERQMHTASKMSFSGERERGGREMRSTLLLKGGTLRNLTLTMVQQERPDTHALSCVSMKIDWSMGHPKEFRKEYSSVGK
ncbi:unnamed protein product, partial [Coregonus sp. 'balchen']